jgi:hypothetical protein
VVSAPESRERCHTCRVGAAELPNRIYHLATREEWDEACEQGGSYRRSTLDKSVHEEGFVHCSTSCC